MHQRESLNGFAQLGLQIGNETQEVLALGSTTPSLKNKLKKKKLARSKIHGE